MKRVYKYPFQVQDEFVIAMPADGQVLHVEAQGDQPCMWALVDPEKPMVDRTFYLRGTGHPVAPELAYVGSFQVMGGRFVGHVFEEGS